MKNIIIIGGGGHAKVVASVLKNHPDWNPIGYTDIIDKGQLLGLPYLGDDFALKKIQKDKAPQYLAIGIGLLGDFKKRREIISNLQSLGIQFPPIISKNAIVNECVENGQGTVVMDGVILQPGVSIGDFSIVNTGATIDHDCKLGDFVHIAPGANVSGDVNIGDNVLIGTGAAIIQGIQIVDNVLIGAGAAVVKNIIERGVYVGTPARKLTP